MVWSGWGGAVYSGFCAGKIGDDEMGPGGGGWILNNFYVLIEEYQEKSYEYLPIFMKHIGKLISILLLMRQSVVLLTGMFLSYL